MPAPRRLLSVTALVAGLLVAGAGPASAVPEGWSEPDPVSGFTVLWMMIGIPLGAVLLVALMVYVPALVRGERVAPGSGRVEELWIGGPRQGTKELAGPDSDESQAGGARGTW